MKCETETPCVISAAICHIHVRGPDGAPTHSKAMYEEIRDLARAESDLNLNFTTSKLEVLKELPAQREWMAVATGKDQLPIDTLGIILGGHCRTGFEDNFYYRRGEKAKSNAQRGGPMRQRVGAAILTILLGLPRPSVAQQPGWDRGFDALMDSIRVQWKVPGMAVAVVSKGRVIHMAGYGLRDVAAKLPVTTDTKFAIASISKSFTVTTLAALAKQGKIEWDRQVRDYLPDFRMYDPVVTERMTIRDLVTHRSGLARHDLMWGVGVYGREDLYQRLRYLQPNKDFRTTWQYQNLMFTTAGYLAGKVNGSTWEDLVQTAVFTPLRMTNSGTSIDAYTRSPNIALPYALHDADTLIPVPWRSTDAIAPTGGVHASLDDLTRYLTMHMQGGMFEGREIIARADSRAMQTPQMAMQQPMTTLAGEFPELGDEAYGMGLLVTNYRGHKLVHHPGNWDGYSLELSFLPNDSLGVVVLTNMYSTILRDFVPWLIYDRLLGLPPSNWNARFLDRRGRIRAVTQSQRAAEEASRVPNTAPSHPLDAYVGRYSHPAYGDMMVSRDGDGLRLKFGASEFPLPHFHYDVFRFAPPAGNPVHNRFRWRVTFNTDVDGSVGSISAPVEPTVGPIVFTRRQPTRPTPP